ncbi:MAG: hypothetical protein V1798_03915 [Pseudomonadota bacterium]
MLPIPPKKAVLGLFVLVFISLWTALVFVFAKEKEVPKPPKEACVTLVVTLKNALGGSASNHRATLDRITSRLSSATGHDVKGLETISRSRAYITALAHKANLLVEISPASMDESGFAGVVLIDVESEKVLGDTSVSTDKSDPLVTKITDWYKELTSQEVSCAAYDVSKVLARLKVAGRCDEVLDALNVPEVTQGVKDEEERALSTVCESQQREAQDRRTGPSALTLAVRFEGVPVSLQGKCYEAVAATQLDRRTAGMSQGAAQLLMACGSPCTSGSFRLTLPFDEAWFRAHIQKGADPLAPYRSLGADLLKTRAKAPAPVASFQTELVLTNQSGSAIRVMIDGGASNPRLKAQTPAKDFFPEAD